MKPITYIIVLILIFISFSSGFSQQYRSLSKLEKNQIDRLSEIAELQLNSNEIPEAATTYSQIAFIFWKAGRPREAIDNFINSADLFLQKNRFEETKNIYSNIGVIYTDLEELEFGLEYFEKSLEVRRKIGKKEDISAGLIDVAYIMQVLNFNDDAVERLTEALALAKEEKNSRLILDCYQLLSFNYDLSGNIKKSQEYSNMATSYQAYLDEENLIKDFASQNVQQEQKMAQTEEEKRLAALQFALNQERFKRSKDSLNYAIGAKQDSLMQAGKLARAANLEIETLNQQREIDALKQSELEGKQKTQQLFISIAIGAIIFMVIVAIIILRASRARKRANNKLAKQNKEIEQQKDQIGSALKKIAHQNQNITQSINYAKGIQQALLPKPEALNNYIKESFIHFKPRDIVSGDFYWFREIDSKSDIFKIFGMHRRGNDESKTETASKKFILSAIDCTGHGVPGAFMSMIGYNLLDEITNKGITRPDLILEELHRGVRFTLKQKETNNQDGMDMAVCVVNEKEKTLEYSGAKNPIIYIQDNEVKQIKGDKYGIGGKSDEHKFTLHKIPIDKPTWFYIFSDGYIDQFGGETGRKFMIKRFREMLFEIHKKPMEEQKEYLNQIMKEWKGTKYSQIDDILVMGFKLDLS